MHNSSCVQLQLSWRCWGYINKYSIPPFCCFLSTFCCFIYLFQGCIYSLIFKEFSLFLPHYVYFTRVVIPFPSILYYPIFFYPCFIYSVCFKILYISTIPQIYQYKVAFCSIPASKCLEAYLTG